MQSTPWESEEVSTHQRRRGRNQSRAIFPQARFDNCQPSANQEGTLFPYAGLLGGELVYSRLGRRAGACIRQDVAQKLLKPNFALEHLDLGVRLYLRDGDVERAGLNGIQQHTPEVAVAA